MLAMTKKTDYALIALSFLARRTDTVMSARALAEQSGTPLSILTNILKALAQASIVKSTRGPRGGYALARSSETISLHELITAIEGPFQFVQCTMETSDDSKPDCELAGSCPIRTPAFKIREHFRRFLENVSLAELVLDDGGKYDVKEGNLLTGTRWNAATELSV
jgi:Rrf2 family protein